jgi:hypothetical protein
MQTTRKPKTMKKRFAFAGSVLALSWLCLARAGTLFTSPFIFVSPTTLDFGAVARQESATNSFLVENVGSGILVGQATVPPPFKILSGGSYRLERNAAQVVTIVYTPDGAPTNTQTVIFSGKDNQTTATVIGRLSTVSRPRHPKRR